MRARAVLVLCLALATVAGAINAARAADYPTRPIKLVVPYPAGGPTDVLGRMVADFLTRDLKQPVFVENKGGAQGAIGAEAAARAEPDGYTLFFTVASIVVLNPVLYKKLAYDPDRDFRMLAIVTDSPLVMVVHPSVEYVYFFTSRFFYINNLSYVNPRLGYQKTPKFKYAYHICDTILLFEFTE